MFEDNERKQAAEGGARHLTTRRGFVACVGFGVVSLYGLWAGYGAAPISLDFLSEPSDSGEGMAGMHGGSAMPAEEFYRRQEAFITTYGLPDGSVMVGRAAAASLAAEAGHGEPAAASEELGATAMADDQHGAEDGGGDGGAPVYLSAFRWGYDPNTLRLEAGVPYRFVILAEDVTHGASIGTGRGSRMIRCPAGIVIQTQLTFTVPGEHLIYCSTYCVHAHDKMMGRIIVT